MRPIGVMPDWASTGLQFGPGDQGAGGIVPETANAAVRNWIYARLRQWKTYRDAIEALSFGADEAPDTAQGQSFFEFGADLPAADRGPHLFYDPYTMQFVYGQRNGSDPTQAGVTGSYNPFNFAGAPVASTFLTSTGDGVHTADFYVVPGLDTTVPASPYNAFVASLNLRGVSIGGAYAPQLENTAELHIWRGGGWSGPGNPIPSDLLRIGTLIYDPEDDRFYLFGTTTGGAVIIKGMKISGGLPFTFEDYDIRPDAIVTTDVPQFCAMATGSKVMSNGTTIFRTVNRFTPWHAWPVSTLMPGATLVKGLYRADTDGLFVAMTDAGVWTSTNGVLWGKTDAPEGTYTGAGASLGGVAALVFKDANTFRVAVATNSFREWRTINCPFHKASGDDPVQQIFALDNRLMALSTDNPVKCAATLRL